MQVKSDTVPKLPTETVIPQNGKQRKPFLAVQRPCQQPISGIALHGSQKDAFFSDMTDWMCVSDRAWAVCVLVWACIIAERSYLIHPLPYHGQNLHWLPYEARRWRKSHRSSIQPPLRRGSGPVDYLLSLLSQRTALSAPTSPSEHNNTNAGEPQSSCTVGH